MGGGGKGGGGEAYNGPAKISSIPAGSKKIVLSLKEVVNCPEAEIYAVLKECNMDPNEAVNRLISQDPFHQVKSKREKKKENKETTDSRPRNPYSASNRGNRTGSDRYSGRGGSSHFKSSESSGVHRKPAYKKENGMHGYANSSSSGMAGNSTNQWAPPISDSVSIENKTPTVGMSDPQPASMQPSSGFQSAWGGASGQVSMADIVKRGLQRKTPIVPNTPYQSVSKVKAESEVASSEHDEWPSIEQPPLTNLPSVLEASSGADIYTDSSNVSFERTNQPVNSQLDEVRESEDDDVGTNDANHIHEDNSRGSSLFDNNVYENMNSYQSHRHPFEHNGAEDGASSMADNLQQLSLQNDDQGTQPEEDKRTVIIPDHLQVHTPDCSHLSFGSFGAGIGFSGQIGLKDKLEEPSEAADNSTIEHLDNRNSEYYGDDHLINNTDESIVHQVNSSTANYDSPSVSQPEVLKQDSSEESQTNQYAFPSAPEYNNYEHTQQQLNATFSQQQQTNSQMQHLSTYSNLMQAYANSLPSTMLSSGVPTARETEIPYSPFPVMQQSMPTKYSNNAASSISGPSMSMPEALRAASISTAQPTAQTLPGANVATGPALPQHLAMHPYTQLGPFPNMISYPFVHQSFAYMPQAFAAGNSNYHQSLAAMLPQYKNNASVSNLPQSAAVPSGYGFGNSASVTGGNFPLNPATAPAGSAVGYDDVLSSQFKEINHLASLQQNDNSAMWLHGHGSRTMPAVPANTYYNYQGQQSQQAQQQQPPSQQHYGGAHGYANFYQQGMPVDHQQQQQNSRDGGSQGQQSKQAQQLWQNNY